MSFAQLDGHYSAQIVSHNALARRHLTVLGRVRDEKFRCRFRGVFKDGMGDGLVAGDPLAGSIAGRGQRERSVGAAKEYESAVGAGQLQSGMDERDEYLF